LHGFGAAVEVVGTEIVIEGAVLEHVVGGGEDRGGDGADRLFGAAPRAQAMELRLEIAAVFACGRPGALDQGGFEPGGAPRLREGRLLRMRLDRRLPALSSFLGQKPDQEIRCPTLGKRPMSPPISARMT
jgi:hypothetical protein